MADGVAQDNSSGGSASDVITRIEAFLGERSRQTPLDFDGVITKATAHLADLLSLDMIADDPTCRSIIAALSLAEDGEAFASEIERLLARTTLLLGSMPAGQRPRRRAGSKPALQVIAEAMHVSSTPPAPARASRVIVRL